VTEVYKVSNETQHVQKGVGKKEGGGRKMESRGKRRN
jgi:hypothetical protein